MGHDSGDTFLMGLFGIIAVLILAGVTSGVIK